ncbi:MAG: hypothetical protein V1808_00715 [Candidatus Daviesbacteria bacterium]
MEMEVQRGILEGAPKDATRVRLIRHLAKDLPDFWLLVDALKIGGLRNHGQGNSQSPVVERNFRVASEHNLCIGLVTDKLAIILGLESTPHTILVSGGLIHDASKKMEITMMEYLNKLRTGTEPEQVKAELEGFVGLVCRAGINYPDQAIGNLQGKNFIEASVFFDQHINTPFLRSIFRSSSFEPEEQDEVIEVAGSDSFGAMPKTVSRAVYFSQELKERDLEVDKFLETAAKMNLPAVTGNQTDLLAATLVYADAIVGDVKMNTKKGNVLTTQIQGLALRKKLSMSSPRYVILAEEARPYYGGENFFNVSYGAVDVIEKVIVQRGKNNGTLDLNISPDDLPNIILSQLQHS